MHNPTTHQPNNRPVAINSDRASVTQKTPDGRRLPSGFVLATVMTFVTSVIGCGGKSSEPTSADTQAGKGGPVNAGTEGPPRPAPGKGRDTDTAAVGGGPKEKEKEKVYTTPAELFAGMPKDAYPKFGSDGGIERAAARKWAKTNLVGRTVEWTATVKEVQIDGDAPFTVRLITETEYSGGRIGLDHCLGFLFGGMFSLGGQPCQAILNGEIHQSFQTGETRTLRNLMLIRFDACTLAEATALRKLKDKPVTLRARVSEVVVGDTSFSHDNGVAKVEDRVTFGLSLTSVSVDGFRPEADRKKK